MSNQQISIPICNVASGNPLENHCGKITSKEKASNSLYGLFLF
ncbi:hypothetical protein ACYSNM_10700 [Myroides sp. LJL116]